MPAAQHREEFWRLWGLRGAPKLGLATKMQDSARRSLHLRSPAVDAKAQATPPAETLDAKGTFLLTIFLKHDQSKPLEQINAQLRQQGFYKAFPPDGVELVSWYVMMGIGEVVTLRVRLRTITAGQSS
jgi:hypothetical protein